MKLVHTQAELTRKTGLGQLREDTLQVACVHKPNAVGHNLVKAKAKLCRPAAHDVHELGIKEWLPSGEAENAYSIGMRVLQKAQRGRNRQALGPFNRHTA